MRLLDTTALRRRRTETVIDDAAERWTKLSEIDTAPSETTLATIADRKNIETFRDEWPLPTTTYDSNHEAFLNALTEGLDDIDDTVSELYDARYIQLATGQTLTNLAEPYGVTRQPGETDTELEYRAQLTRVARTSTGTINDVVRLLDIAFDGDLTRITLTAAGDEPRILVGVPLDMLADIPIDQSLLETLLTATLPSSDDATVLEPDLLRLDGPEFTPTSEQTLDEGELS